MPRADKRPSDLVGTNLFQQLLRSSKLFVFSSPDEPFHFLDEPARLRLFLERKLRLSPTAVKAFLSGLDEHVEDEGAFHKLLLRTVPRNKRRRAYENGVGGVGYCTHNQDSLVRVLLGVEVLQDAVVKRLLERLPLYMDPEHNAEQERNLPQLILNQLRWLDSVYNGEDLSLKLLEIVHICPPNLQRDIIAAIPEIVTDSCNEIMVQALQSLMAANTELTVSVLEALSNLNLPSELLAVTTDQMVESLGSVQLTDLPLVLRFLLQTSTKETAGTIIGHLRDKLNIVEVGAQQNGKQSTGDLLLVIDALRTSVRFKQDIAAAFLKAITAVTDKREQKVLDVWILLVLHSLPRWRSKATQAFKRKVSLGLFTDALLVKALATEQEAVDNLFDSLLSIADEFVRNTTNNVARFGAHMYQSMFGIFGDRFHRQEIIGSLITHIGSAAEEEMDTSIDALLYLVKANPASVEPYTAFVKGILDYLDNLSDSQIRKVFTVFSILAMQTDPDVAGGGESGVSNDLRIVIRKQLFCPSSKYQEMGIIGAVILATQIAPSHIKDDLPKWREQQAQELVDTLFQHANGSPVALSFVYDELSRTVQANQLHPNIVETLSGQVAERFEGGCLCDLGEGGVLESSKIQGSSMPGAAWMNIDGADANISINIFPMLVDAGARDKLACMCAEFRLLQVCEAAISQGSLSGIDALLGCPMLLFEETLLEGWDKVELEDRAIICSTLFHAVNWLREVVNGFASQEDEEMRGKVCRRVRELLHLEALLETYAAKVPGFVPLADAEKREGRSDAFEDIFKEEVSGSALAISQQPEKPKSHRRKTKSPSLDLPLRELEVSTVTLLHTPILVTTEAEAEPFPKQLTASMLRYLLRDMGVKLKSLLSPPKKSWGAAPAGPSKPGCRALLGYTAETLVAKYVPVFPPLRKHVLTMAQLLEAESASEEEDDSATEALHVAVTECLLLVVSIFSIILKCPVLKRSQHHPLVVQVFLSFTDHLARDPVADCSVSEASERLFASLQTLLPACSKRDFAAAVALVKVLEATVMYPPNSLKGAAEKLSEIAGQMLIREWGTGARFKADTISVLVRIHVCHAPDSLERLLTLAATVLPDCETENAFQTTLNAKTLRFYFVPIIEQLLVCVQTTRADPDRAGWFIGRYTQFAEVFGHLTGLCKRFPKNRTLLAASIKQGCIFLEDILKRVAFLDKHFTAHRTAVLALVRLVQHRTRLLQIICSHGKQLRVSAVTSHVPKVKRLMETFIYQIKGLFKSHNLMSAFQEGTLKDRKMDGSEVQIESEEESEGTQSEED